MLESAMFSDYEEDELFETSIDSFQEFKINWSLFSKDINNFKFSNDSFNSSSIESNNEFPFKMISKLKNNHILKLLSDLVKTFFEIEHEIQNFLNFYLLTQKKCNKAENFNYKNKLINKNSTSVLNEVNLENNFLETKDNKKNENLKLVKAKQLFLNDESDLNLCENVILSRKQKNLKIVTQEIQNVNENSIISETKTINNSNYYEISCSYIVQLNNFKNNKILEDKKTYISANININNCLNTQKNKIYHSLDSDDEEYSDATNSSNLESIEYPNNIWLKPENNFNEKENTENVGKFNSNEDISKQTQSLSEIINQKMIIFNENLKHYINHSMLDEQNSLKISEIELNDLNFIEEEEIVISLCKRLKIIINELILLMKCIINEDDDFYEKILNKNAELSAKLVFFQNEIKSLENKFKNINKKESNFKLDMLKLKTIVCEFKQNKKRLDWLKAKINDLKNEIDNLKENEKQIKNNEIQINDVLSENENLNDLDDNFEDNFEDNFDFMTDNEEILLFDRNIFENVLNSIKISSQQTNLMNLIENEKHELSKLIDKLKIETEQLVINNEELKKKKQLDLEDHILHLNSIKNSISLNKKFLNEQNFEIDNEKDSFASSITRINCLIKEKELNISKYEEKINFYNSDIIDLSREKDDLQCKNYNFEKKLVDINNKHDELKGKLEKAQLEKEENIFRIENLKKKINETEKLLDAQKILTDKLNFDEKLDLDPSFLDTLEVIINKICKYQMEEKIRENLICWKLNQEKISSSKNKEKLVFKKSKSFIKPKTNNQSFTTNSAVKINKKSIKMQRSKSFIDGDNFYDKNKLIKLNDDAFSKFYLKLKNSSKNLIDDDEFYSFKECQSLISLNNTLDKDVLSLNSNSTYDSTSSLFIDNNCTLSDEKNNMNELKKIHLSKEDLEYLSLTNQNLNNYYELNDLYLTLEKCNNSEKLKYYAFTLSNFFSQVSKKIKNCKDSLQTVNFEIKTKKEKLDKLQKKFDVLNTNYEKDKKNLDKMQISLNNEHLEISELKNRIDSYEIMNSFGENEEQIKNLDDQILNVEENNFYLKTNLETLDNELNEKNVDLNIRQSELNEMKKNCFEMANENNMLKSENNYIEQENFQLQEKLKKLREQKLYKKLSLLSKLNEKKMNEISQVF